MKQYWKHIKRLLVSPVVAYLAVAIALFSLTANSQQQQRQTQHLRVVVCSVLEPYASLTPATANGAVLQKSFDRARGPDGANCTPDPDDGK